MANTNGFIKMAMGALVVIIVAAGVILPLFASAEVTAGDEITKTNDTSIVLREAVAGDVLKCTSTYDSDTSTRADVWTLNGETITSLSGSSAAWNVGIMSDGVYMQINAASNAASGIFHDMTASTPAPRYMTGATAASPERVFTFTVGDSSIVWSNSEDSTTYSFEYTWGYVICPYADGEYCAAVAGGVGYVASAADVILCGAYTSGELDTMYYYHDGTTYVSNEAYTMTADIETEITDGTTDIYTATVSVDMSDGVDTETFTPYRILVPYEVTGHATSGLTYTIVSILPVIILVGVLMMVVTAFISNRRA